MGLCVGIAGVEVVVFVVFSENFGVEVVVVFVIVVGIGRMKKCKDCNSSLQLHLLMELFVNVVVGFLFPLAYWFAIREEAAQRDLDPEILVELESPAL